MRFLFALFLLTASCLLSAQTRAGFSADELLLKRFGSKKKYPATVLRYEPDAFTDLVAVNIYQGKSLYTGNIIDEKNGSTIYATVGNGVVTHFVSDDPGSTRRQVYAVTNNALYAWYATDSVFYENQLMASSVFYQHSNGLMMMVTREYSYDGWITERSYRIGSRAGGKTEYNDPLEEGAQNVYHNGNLLVRETYHNGHLEGEFAFYDEEHTLLLQYYVNALTGLYGRYYEYDPGMNITTTGYYNNRGIETGKWISTYADSSVARILWIGANGNPDSSKSWDVKGNLVGVDYNFWKWSASPGVNDYVHFSKTWYSNGQLATWMDYNPQPGDTVMASFDITGLPQVVEREMNGRVQTKTWHSNGTLRSERYGVPTRIPGVTVRDSVYREWDAGGMLTMQHYYENGKFTGKTTLPYDTQNVLPLPPFPWDHVALLIANSTPVKQRSWDAAPLVPQPVIDSLNKQIAAVHFYCLRHNHEAKSAFRARQTQITSGYTLKLAGMESVKLDSNDRIVTDNARLNNLLDSFGIRSNGVAPLGNYHRKKGKVLGDFSLPITNTPEDFNLFYLNRRLQQVAPGSRLNCPVNNSPEALAAEIIYIPQGEPTGFGVTPVAVLAIADDSQQAITDEQRLSPYSNRTFSVFYIYGDGEVEFAGTSDKYTVLLNYRSERTGVFAKPANR